jgi:hypothetical protein
MILASRWSSRADAVRRVKRGIVALVAIGTIGMVAAPPTQATTEVGSPAGPRYTKAQIAAMSPAQQATVLGPLRAIANAVGGLGRTTEADLYSGLQIDAPAGVVYLYVTDPARADILLNVSPEIDRTLVRVRKGTYSLAALHAARDRLTSALDAGQLPYSVYSAAVPADGSGLILGVPDVAAAQRITPNRLAALSERSLADVVGVPLTFEQSAAVQPKYNRYNDSAPFIAGDQLRYNYSGGYADCTSGIPAVRISDGHNFLVTAQHCFPGGSTINTNTRTKVVGKVTAWYGWWDAELIDTQDNADAGLYNCSGACGYVPVGSSAYSYNGDFVCQDGLYSYYKGHGVPCGIEVINQDYNYYTLCAWYNGICYHVRGVEGKRAAGGASIDGDSGALVFTGTSSSNQQQARGIVSAGFANDPNNYYMLWTESPDILGHFGLRLNPVQ